MVRVRGVSDTNVREQSQQAVRTMPLADAPAEGATEVTGVALNTGMVKSWLMTCERVQQVPHLQGT